MADPVLKFPPEQKNTPEQKGTPGSEPVGEPAAPSRSAPSRRRAGGSLRRYRRPLLLIVLPIVALIGGIAFYLEGGRYVTTDDAYVGAQKVLITPDVSGKIVSIAVKEGQTVAPGDVMFQIDPVPYQLAAQQARAKLADAKTSYNNLRSNVKIFGDTITLLDAGIQLKQRDVERKTSLVKNLSGSQLDLDNSNAALVTAKAQLELAKQQQEQALNQLQGNTELPLEQYPAYAQAKAALDDAERNLNLSTVRAPMRGTATQVDAIQIGRFVAAGTPVFSVIDTLSPWVDANPKESDFTYVAVGQDVTVDVDAFPDHQFKAKVGSLSPGTGAQFSVLPPQNATGNFVKVVQRVPIRLYFDENDPMVKKLKAGMSVYVSVDTHHTRSLAGLFGLRSATASPENQ